MHELVIAQSMISIAEQHAMRAGVGRVTQLHCRVGALRQIDDALLRGAFEFARAGTACASAELRIEHGSLAAACSACGTKFDVVGWNWACPRCGGEGTLQPGSDELELVAIDAEDGP